MIHFVIRHFVSDTSIPSCLFVLWAAVRSIHILAVIFIFPKGKLSTGRGNYTGSAQGSPALLQQENYWILVGGWVWSSWWWITRLSRPAKPLYLQSRLSHEHSYKTSQWTSGCIRMDQSFRYKGDIPRNSFRCRGANSYNSIPAEIRASMTMVTFKSKLRK